MHVDLCVHEKKNTESVKNNSQPKVKWNSWGKKKKPNQPKQKQYYQHFLISIFYFVWDGNSCFSALGFLKTKVAWKKNLCQVPTSKHKCWLVLKNDSCFNGQLFLFQTAMSSSQYHYEYQFLFSVILTKRIFHFMPSNIWITGSLLNNAGFLRYCIIKNGATFGKKLGKHQRVRSGTTLGNQRSGSKDCKSRPVKIILLTALLQGCCC